MKTDIARCQTLNTIWMLNVVEMYLIPDIAVPHSYKRHKHSSNGFNNEGRYPKCNTDRQAEIFPSQQVLDKQEPQQLTLRFTTKGFIPQQLTLWFTTKCFTVNIKVYNKSHSCYQDT